MWYVQVRHPHATDPPYALFQHACVTTVEALLLRALYMLLSDDPGSAQKVWGNLGLITKLAMSVSDAYLSTLKLLTVTSRLGSVSTG